jgi:hypothetical protein
MLACGGGPSGRAIALGGKLGPLGLGLTTLGGGPTGAPRRGCYYTKGFMGLAYSASGLLGAGYSWRCYTGVGTGFTNLCCWFYVAAAAADVA